MKDRLILIRLHWKYCKLEARGIHIYTNPRPGQYLSYAHSLFTRAVAATDTCFALTHQQGKAVGLMNGENPRLKNLLLLRRVRSCLPSASSTQRMWELLAGNRTSVLHNTCGNCWLGALRQFSHDIRGEGGSWVCCMCAPCFNLSFENSELNCSTA